MAPPTQPDGGGKSYIHGCSAKTLNVLPQKNAFMLRDQQIELLKGNLVIHLLKNKKISRALLLISQAMAWIH